MTYDLPKIGSYVYLKSFAEPIEIRVDEILITECATFIIHYLDSEKYLFTLGKQVFLEV